LIRSFLVNPANLICNMIIVQHNKYYNLLGKLLRSLQRATHQYCDLIVGLITLLEKIRVIGHKLWMSPNLFH